MINTRLATAEWADPSVVTENYFFESGDFWLGRGVDGNSVPLGYLDDRHVCLVSGGRGGKGTSIIINNLCTYPGSVVVIDPKGENATITAARRGDGSEYCEGIGQKVLVLDPFSAAQIEEKYRSFFNPLDALDPNDEESIDEAGRIADALVVMNPESKDPFWDESARAMIKGLILHVLTDDNFEGRRNLVTIRDLITRGDWETFEHLKSKGMEGIPSPQFLLWEGVKQNNVFYGIVAGIGETFAGMAANSPKQFESVLQVANRNTEFLDSPGMRKCLAVSDFKLSDLKTNPQGVSLYLCLPQRYMNTHYRWLRMMIALTVNEMEKVQGQPATGHRVLMCLDEFAGLKRMEVIENAVAQIAGYGVKMFFVLQSLEQLKATYKDNWETFLSNCGLKIFFNLEDHFSREYVSKFVGDTEIIRELRTSSESLTHTQSKSHTESYNKSKTRSYNKSDSYSQNHSQSSGTNHSKNRSTGSSDGMSWKRKFFFFRGNKQYNEGHNRSDGTADGTNKSQSDGVTRGGSNSYGASSTEGYGTSDTVSESVARGTTQGRNETLHKRPLISPDEIGRFFGRINDKFHPAYPGMALVLVSGENPFPVRRANYFQDPHFYKLFNPHPDHDNTIYEILISPPDQELLDYISTSSNLEFSVYDDFDMSEGSSYMKLGMNEDLKNFSRLSRPFLRLGKTINDILPTEISYAKSLPLSLDTPVTGHLSKIDETRAVIKTEYPKINYEIEEQNQEKIKNQTLAQQNRYRIATLLALVCTAISIVVALIGAIQVPLFGIAQI